MEKKEIAKKMKKKVGLQGIVQGLKRYQKAGQAASKIKPLGKNGLPF